jgi:hypothetical protein
MCLRACYSDRRETCLARALEKCRGLDPDHRTNKVLNNTNINHNKKALLTQNCLAVKLYKKNKKIKNNNKVGAPTMSSAVI